MTSNKRRWCLYEYPFAINYMLYYFFHRGPSMVWNYAKDEVLCKEILLFEPYQYKERTKEKGNCWKLIAENLNQIKSMSVKVDQRAVRERYKLIRAKYIDKEEEEEKGRWYCPRAHTS